MKYRLLAFLVLAEAKLQAVTVKLGEQEEVEAMLVDYRNFMEEQRLFEQFDATYRDCKLRADAYRKQKTTDARELERMSQTFDDVNKRWKHVKVEMMSAQTMLEEVIQYWKRYNACADLFNVYLADAERVVEQTAEQRAVSNLHCIVYTLVCNLMLLSKYWCIFATFGT